MINQLALILIVFLLVGCGTTDRRGLTQKQIEPIEILSIRQFEGLYGNNPEGYGPSLSALIFPGSYKFVEQIYVKAIDDFHLEIQALKGGQEVLRKVLTLGKDFEVSHSNVPLSTKVKGHKSGRPDVWFDPPHGGASISSGELFLNADGDLIYHRSTSGAFLVFYVVPFIANGDDFGIYRKVKH